MYWDMSTSFTETVRIFERQSVQEKRRILLFGVSNVGKSVTGELLTERLNYDFYDLDEEVKKHFAITPLSYIQAIQPLVSSRNILAIELIDSAENIFDRLVFSDENDIIYKDDNYKNQHKEHYFSEIRDTLKWYGFVYRDIKYHFDMSGRSTADVVDGLIAEYHLKNDSYLFLR